MDSSYSGEPSVKKHKKHKKDRGDKYNDGYIGQTPPGIKLLLKLGGSSTPEHSDSPGPSHLSVMNTYDATEDSQHSSISMSQHAKKSKKKDKKKKKDKRHKHHHKEKKRQRDKEDFETSSVSMMDAESTEIKAEVDIPPSFSSQPLSLDDGGNSNSASQGALPSAPVTTTTRPTAVTAAPVKIPKLVDRQPFQKLLDHLLRALEKKDIQQFFAWPVTDKIAPGYSSIIKRPMDFSTMKSKVDSETYCTLPEFATDFYDMCHNAMTYNDQETIYFKAAKKLLQGGAKLLSSEKIRSLLPLIPSIRLLGEEHLGFALFPDSVIQNDSASMDNILSEEENIEHLCLDPTKSVHYVPPHPNDPPDICGAFTDDLTTEEVLLQARLAAREAAHRLATKKPNAKMGFLRQRPDGSTSLAILAPTTGVLPGTREQPVTLGSMSGKLLHGTAQLHSAKEDKRNLQRPLKPVYYGAFSSYAPNQDSTFSNLTSEESDMLCSTYGDETAIQYAESMIEFAKGCDYAMHMVDEILDTITKGEHRKTVNFVEERKKLEEEERRIKRQQEDLTNQLEMEWKHVSNINDESTLAETAAQNVNFEALQSLNDLGIDTQFLDEFKGQNSVGTKLQETAELIGDLEKMQNERLSQTAYPVPPYVHHPSEQESQLASRITENLTDMAKQTNPGALVSAEAIRKAMGIDINAASFIGSPINPGMDRATEAERNSSNFVDGVQLRVRPEEAASQATPAT